MRLRYSLGAIALLVITTGCAQSSSPTSPDTPSCSFVVSPRTQVVSSAGGSFSATVAATSPTCAWTAGVDAPWITVTGASPGTAGTIVYDVQENRGASARTGAVMVGLGSATTSVTVTQSGN